MAREDFVNVKLSQHGEEFVRGSGGGELRIVSGSHEFIFKPGEIKEVTRAFDWGVVLSNVVRDGKALFEVAVEDEAAHAAPQDVGT